MASVQTVKATGLFTQKHVDALLSASSIFTPEIIHKTTLPTGLTVEYVLHATALVAPAADESPEALEDRVIMIVGFMQRKEEWAPMMRMMLDKYNRGEQKKALKILTMDNRGMGGSSVPWGRYTTSGMARDVLALMSHVGWQSAHVVGVSMGGMISLELAAQAPERVRSLSLIVTTRGKYTEDPRSKEPMRGTLVSRAPKTFVDCTLKLLYPEESLAKAMEADGMTQGDALSAFHLSELKQRSPAPARFGVLAQIVAIKTHFVSDERLTGIRDAGFPILIVGGMQDILIPPAESITLYERMKADHVKPLFFEDAGHGVFNQYVEEVADGLVGNFARCAP